MIVISQLMSLTKLLISSVHSSSNDWFNFEKKSLLAIIAPEYEPCKYQLVK